MWQCFELWAAAVDQAAEERRAAAKRDRRISAVQDSTNSIQYVGQHLKSFSFCICAIGSLVEPVFDPKIVSKWFRVSAGVFKSARTDHRVCYTDHRSCYEVLNMWISKHVQTVLSLISLYKTSSLQLNLSRNCTPLNAEQHSFRAPHVTESRFGMLDVSDHSFQELSSKPQSFRNSSELVMTLHQLAKMAETRLNAAKATQIHLQVLQASPHSRR